MVHSLPALIFCLALGILRHRSLTDEFYGSLLQRLSILLIYYNGARRTMWVGLYTLVVPNLFHVVG